VVRYKNEIHALLVVLFPEFTQVFADPTRPTALAVLKRYPSAQAVAQTEVETLGQFLHELAPRHYGRPTAQELVELAKTSISSGVAVAARSSSLRILCDQLDHTQKNLEQLQREINQLLDQDPKAKGMLSVPEFGPTTVAVLRAELGDLTRFTRIDQVVAYVGLDRARSNRAANGKGRPSCPSTAAAECAASCTWPRYGAFTWKHLPLGLTTSAWWLGA
jgi:transposase